MKKMFIWLAALLAWQGTSAQSCFPEGITFSSQPQINNFQSQYPNCTEVGGDMIITGANITNLNGLTSIISIEGSLVIECNPELTGLSGLNNLVYIGGDLHVEENLLITNFIGLTKLNHVGGNIIIENNPAMTNLAGLQGLTAIPGMLWIDHNNHLFNLTGLNNVTGIDGFIRITSNRELVTLSGLDQLAYTGESVLIGGQDHLGSMGNPSLISLEALASLTSIGGYLEIAYNTSLTSLSGLDNIAAGSISELSVYNNINLSECEVLSVCDFLSNPGGEIYIAGNAPGCSSIGEVEAACIMTGRESNPEGMTVRIYPNPVRDILMVEMTGQTGEWILQIAGLTNPGTIVHLNSPGTVIDVSGLPAGLYVVKITGDRFIWTGKLVKQ